MSCTPLSPDEAVLNRVRVTSEQAAVIEERSRGQSRSSSGTKSDDGELLLRFWPCLQETVTSSSCELNPEPTRFPVDASALCLGKRQ